MKGTWFVVTCRVDNGCRIETWDSIVYAVTPSSAEMEVLRDWISHDSETTVQILSTRKLSEKEITRMQVR